jgi:hypothetical protein
MNQLNDSLCISKTPVVIQRVTIETITPYPVVKQLKDQFFEFVKRYQTYPGKIVRPSTHPGRRSSWIRTSTCTT